MNKYTEDGNHIIDSTGKLWPVDTPHLLPLPEGIEPHSFISTERAAYGAGCSILFAGHDNWGSNGGKEDTDTHWLARRPLPPVPKPKTREELDEEASKEWAKQQAATPSHSVYWELKDIWEAFKAGIAHGRKEAK